MTKSFLIALAGFAVGLGVTTALVFIAPGPTGPDMAAGTPDATTSVARTPVARTPEVEQRIALALPQPDREPPPAPAAKPEKTAQTPAVKPPPPPAQTVPSALSGPAMPAVKRTEIAALPLAKPEEVETKSTSGPAPGPAPGPATGSAPGPASSSAPGSAAAPSNGRPRIEVDPVEALRWEQMDHENVRVANLTEPPVRPPAPPPLPPSETVPQVPSSPAALPGGGDQRGAWQRFAALTPPIEGRAQVAIVLDDMGLSQFRSDRAIALPRPITLAILPYGNHLDGLVARARTAGHEILVHMPMEPSVEDADPGPNALLTGLPIAELDRRIATNLLRLDGYVGISNHMGSRFTASERGMRRVMRAVRDRGLLFLDSLTTGKSAGYRLAREHGIPAAVRDIFIDNDRDPAKIRKQLALTAATAREKGYAIAIGHPYPETLNALEAWLPGLRDQGLVLVPISALVRQRSLAATARGAG